MVAEKVCIDTDGKIGTIIETYRIARGITSPEDALIQLLLETFDNNPTGQHKAAFNVVREMLGVVYPPPASPKPS